MDISLNSSAILVIIVGLWLVWVVPFFLRRQEGMPEHQLALARNLPAVTSPSLAEDSSSQGNILENTSKPTSSASPASTPAAAPSAARGSHSPGPSTGPRTGHHATGTVKPFKIRYGRTALAGFGALALVTAVITAVISVIGLVPAYLPILSLVAAVASVAALRALALRDRSKRSEQRVQAAFREAMSPGTGSWPAYPGTAEPAVGSSSAQHTAKAPEAAGNAPKRETKLFDAENPGNEESTGQTASAKAIQGPARTSTASPEGQRLTAEDLRQAALAVAAEADNAPTDEVGQAWQPVDVPKPKYVESAKADRPTPEPLELPAEPKPEGKPSIKAGAVAPKADMKLDQEAVERTEKAKPSGGLHDLDNVLQRRRA